jgi:hypothetical protein
MENQLLPDSERTGPTGGGRFSWPGLLLALPAGVLVGLVAARVAESAQFELNFTPLILFPLLVGGGIGAVVVGLIRLAQFGNRLTIVLATVLAVAVAVVGQHYLPYQAAQDATKSLETVRRAFPDLAEGRIPAPPASLLDYLRQQAAAGRPIFGDRVVRGWAAWLSWAADALLLLAAALAMVIPATRQPYCNQCGTWYRTVRAGRIDVNTAQRLAALAGLAGPQQAASARYRLASCMGGCGPTRFELTCEGSEPETPSTQSWLDAACRNRMMQVLDEMQAEDGGQEAVNGDTEC